MAANPNLTTADLIRLVRQPGKVIMPVLMPSDVVLLTVEKADLLTELAKRDPASVAPWYVTGTGERELYLDVND